jgi:GNAT superfamily N-acetyltransferase
MIMYSDEKGQCAREVAEVFINSGIKRPFEDIARIQRMIDHSDIFLSAWLEGQMIGVARAITDYSYCCYLSDLAVDRRYQKLGIGKRLVEELQKKIGDECSLVLISSPGAVDYYPQIGFKSTDKAFVISRKK